MASKPEPIPAPSSPRPTRTRSQGESEANAAAAVRLAERADVPALTRMLVRAYMDDPIAVWICDSPGLRARTLAAMYSVRLHQLLSLRGVWTNPRHTSAAIWLPPDCVKPALRPSPALMRCLLDPRVLARAPLLALGLRSMDRVHPEGPPHWYLSLLGTHPEAQGNGLGSAVLEPVLEQCDKDGVGAYLESSKVRNVDFYARFGFQVTGELQIPYGGPMIWPMWREPSLPEKSTTS